MAKTTKSPDGGVHEEDDPLAPSAADGSREPATGAARANTSPSEPAAAQDGEEPEEGNEADDTDEAEPDPVELDESADESADLPPKAALARIAPSRLDRSDPMAAYLREVQRHPLLTPEETKRIAEEFVRTQDPALAARLVTANLRLVVKLAYEYRRAHRNILDLVQEGNIGLMQAVKRYDPYRGVKLSSYAAWWIRAYILRYILNNWRLVKLGTTQAQRKLFFNLKKQKAELEAKGIEPTHAEIAKRLSVQESEVAEMDARLAQNEHSLDAPVGDADGRSIARVDMLPSEGRGPESLAAEEEVNDLLREKLAQFRQSLTERDKDLAIFDLRLVADEPLTLQELGDRFGVSRERVRQIEQRLLGKLREYLKQEIGDSVDVIG